MSRHRGRFKWKKYSRYKGNLRGYWTSKSRTTERHRKVEEMSEINDMTELRDRVARLEFENRVLHDIVANLSRTPPWTSRGS